MFTGIITDVGVIEAVEARGGELGERGLRAERRQHGPELAQVVVHCRGGELARALLREVVRVREVYGLLHCGRLRSATGRTVGVNAITLPLPQEPFGSAAVGALRRDLFVSPALGGAEVPVAAFASEGGHVRDSR